MPDCMTGDDIAIAPKLAKDARNFLAWRRIGAMAFWCMIVVNLLLLLDFSGFLGEYFDLSHEREELVRSWLDGSSGIARMVLLGLWIYAYLTRHACLQSMVKVAGSAPDRATIRLLASHAVRRPLSLRNACSELKTSFRTGVAVSEGQQDRWLIAFVECAVFVVFFAVSQVATAAFLCSNRRQRALLALVIGTVIIGSAAMADPPPGFDLLAPSTWLPILAALRPDDLNTLWTRHSGREVEVFAAGLSGSFAAGLLLQAALASKVPFNVAMLTFLSSAAFAAGGLPNQSLKLADALSNERLQTSARAADVIDREFKLRAATDPTFDYDRAFAFMEQPFLSYMLDEDPPAWSHPGPAYDAWKQAREKKRHHDSSL